MLSYMHREDAGKPELYKHPSWEGKRGQELFRRARGQQSLSPAQPPLIPLSPGTGNPYRQIRGSFQLPDESFGSQVGLAVWLLPPRKEGRSSASVPRWGARIPMPWAWPLTRRWDARHQKRAVLHTAVCKGPFILVTPLTCSALSLSIPLRPGVALRRSGTGPLPLCHSLFQTESQSVGPTNSFCSSSSNAGNAGSELPAYEGGAWGKIRGWNLGRRMPCFHFI